MLSIYVIRNNDNIQIVLHNFIQTEIIKRDYYMEYSLIILQCLHTKFHVNAEIEVRRKMYIVE